MRETTFSFFISINYISCSSKGESVDKHESAPVWSASVMVCIDKPNFVFVYTAVKRRHERQSFIWEVSYPTPRAALPSRSLARGTALHRSKDFAVAPAGLLRRLARACARAPFSFESLCVSAETGVSVRTSRLTPDGRYPLLSCCADVSTSHSRCSDFPL